MNPGVMFQRGQSLLLHRWTAAEQKANSSWGDNHSVISDNIQVILSHPLFRNVQIPNYAYKNETAWDNPLYGKKY